MQCKYEHVFFLSICFIQLLFSSQNYTLLQLKQIALFKNYKGKSIVVEIDFALVVVAKKQIM
jgi:hypothetical protein